MKLPIVDTERDIKAEWWFGHKARTEKKKRGVKGSRVGLKN